MKIYAERKRGELKISCPEWIFDGPSGEDGDKNNEHGYEFIGEQPVRTDITMEQAVINNTPQGWSGLTPCLIALRAAIDMYKHN